MNFRLRQERNAFVFLIVVAMPILLLTAPLAYLTTLSNQKAASGGTQHPQKAKAKAQPNKQGAQARS